MTSIPEWPKTDHPREMIEAAYVCADLFERRRRLMEDWARFLDLGPGEVSDSVDYGGRWILPHRLIKLWPI